MPKITGPLFKWFGSKWGSSGTLPQPMFDRVIEPFAGSAGYSLRHHEKQVVLCESNVFLFDLWSWLISEATEQSIRDIPVSMPEGTDIRELGLSYGQQLLMKNWQRTNNLSACWTVSVWGNKPGQWTANTRARVASEFHHVRHWQIRRDGFETLRSNKDDLATWLVDPPYRYNFRYGCPAFDYVELGGLVGSLRGHVLACEAVCPKTDAVPDWLPFEPLGERVTSRRKAGQHHHSRELLYERRPKGLDI